MIGLTIPLTTHSASSYEKQRALTAHKSMYMTITNHQPFPLSLFFSSTKHLTTLSSKRDDGVSWIPQASGGWGPAQSLLNSHIHTYSRMAAVLRAASPTKVMLGNCNTLCRIDVAGIFDGGFSEGAALNAVAWLGLRRPSILWTYALDGHSDSALDLFFQQHALMRVFPMAPMPGNDHSINPGNEKVQLAYMDYAPIFLALRGLEWVLDAPHPLSVSPSTAGQQFNIFRVAGVPGELIVVVVFGGNATTSTEIIVSGSTLFHSKSVNAFSLIPGAQQTWTPLGNDLPVLGNGLVSVPSVPMSKGCSLLRLVPASE